MTDEATFLAEYDPRKYEPVAVSVDVVVLTIRDGELCVVALERETHPFRGRLCLPGAFVRPIHDKEFGPLDWYAGKALRDKTGIELSVEQLFTSGWPKRDPRMHVISVAYLAFAADIPDPVAGTNVRSARLIPVEEAMASRLRDRWAFDHQAIVGRGVIRARNELEYTSKAVEFLPKEFTIPDLFDVYQTVWGQPIDRANFYRKVKATDGFIRKIPGKRGAAQLYTADRDTEVYPPIRRERGAA